MANSGLHGLARYVPGVSAAVMVAIAAKFLEGIGFGSAHLFAILLGLMLHCVSGIAPAKAGLRFTSSHLLAAGVALLGARLTFADMIALGWRPAIVTALAMGVVMIGSWQLAKLLKLSRRVGLLAGCGTAVCGASAAVAAASVFRKDADLERDTTLVVATVVALSAAAMIIYPFIASISGLSDLEAGVFLGGSIHNVPQAVGAGFAFSEPAGDVATLTKLFRVSLLAPIVVGISLMIGTQRDTSIRSFRVPWFVLVFAALVILGSLFTIPDPWTSALAGASNWLLLSAIAAIGMNTSMASIWRVGGRLVLLVVINSAVLAALLLAACRTGLF